MVLASSNTAVTWAVKLALNLWVRHWQPLHNLFHLCFTALSLSPKYHSQIFFSLKKNIHCPPLEVCSDEGLDVVFVVIALAAAVAAGVTGAVVITLATVKHLVVVNIWPNLHLYLGQALVDVLLSLGQLHVHRRVVRLKHLDPVTESPHLRHGSVGRLRLYLGRRSRRLR